jgi:hypothetical protein
MWGVLWATPRPRPIHPPSLFVATECPPIVVRVGAEFKVHHVENRPPCRNRGAENCRAFIRSHEFRKEWFPSNVGLRSNL